jgi:hypothetical protein
MKNYPVYIVCLLALLSALDSFASDTATGDYLQDTAITEAPSALYNPSLGFHFDGSKTYEKGDFSTYTWTGNQYSTTDAGLLLDLTSLNIHSFACYPNSSLTGLQSPAHDLKEQIATDSSMLSYYEPGAPSNCSSTLKLNIPKDAVSYKVLTDYIPMKRITKADWAGAGDYIDFEYRGVILFMGEEYFVRDISGDVMYLDHGQTVTVSGTGYSAGYLGYAFRMSQVTTNASGCTSASIYVRKPDQSVVTVTAGCVANGLVDDLEIMLVSKGSSQTASILVYDLGSQIVLEDGEDLDMGGHVWTDWQVALERVDTCQADADCTISEYDDMDPQMQDSLLKAITLSYSHDLDGNESLGINQSLLFPNDFRLTYRGYRYGNLKAATCPVTGAVYSTYFLGTYESFGTTTTSTTTTTTSSTTTTTPQCNLPGDTPPCGTIALGEIIDHIIKWSAGQASLSEVIDMINAWMAGT